MKTLNRRALLGGATALPVATAALAALPEAPSQSDAATAPPLQPPSGRPYRPVTTLNGWTLPWRMRNGVKEFHLVAEPVRRELAPGTVAHLWGYNGQSPGPTIEVVEGDRVRLFVTNRLPEATSMHWHGQRLPCGMDGVTGLTQPAIPPGKTFVYEFVAQRAGTFMYHPHADEMVQMAMGMMGFWVTHPKRPSALIREVDRDYVFLLASYDIEPGAATPKVMTMSDFNLWTWNSRVFPGIDPLVARQGERLRIRVGNLTMTNHPIHLHGPAFEVTGTDGGPVPLAARWPEVTVDVAVGQMRQIEVVCSDPGDWAIHCHKSHHTMNAMGHGVPTLIGVDHRGLAGPLQRAVPEMMVMGERGMHDMTEMSMPLPDNTTPMMAGQGPFGAIGMGGMFSVLKVREHLPQGWQPGQEIGWFQHPPGSLAREWTGEAAPVAVAPGATPASAGPALTVRKPSGHAGH